MNGIFYDRLRVSCIRASNNLIAAIIWSDKEKHIIIIYLSVLTAGNSLCFFHYLLLFQTSFSSSQAKTYPQCCWPSLECYDSRALAPRIKERVYSSDFLKPGSCHCLTTFNTHTLTVKAAELKSCRVEMKTKTRKGGLSPQLGVLLWRICCAMMYKIWILIDQKHP